MDNIFTKIKEYGHVNSKLDKLSEICNQNLPQILKHLPRRILNADGGDLLGCILKGLPENTSSCRHKVKVIDIVLQVMRKQSTSLTHCADVISSLCLELPRLPAEDLVRWCNDSLQSIVVDSDVNMIWRDILPECMNALSSYDVIKHCDTEMSFEEYKAQCVHTLCQCQWQERQYVQITAMFKDLQLNRNDHKQVVNKICSYIIDIAVESLPPLVHQLLKLCKMYDLEVVLSHLSNYFSVRLYSKLEPPPQDSESTTMDVDDIVPHNPAEVSRCLSTCIYHITQGAAEPELVRKHIKAWPKTQMLRAPFIMDIVLAMSNKGAEFKSVCLEALKSAIEQREMDLLRSRESALIRCVLPPDVDIVSVLKVLTTESANHRQLTVVGIVNLAFSLLSMVRTKPVAQACWSHGKLILVRLCKSQPETTGHILSQLADRLAGNCDQRQYAECLYVMCKLTPVSLEGCTQLGAILENCQPSPSDYRDAAAVLDAVHPLLNFSMRTRDTLVMVCRKGLHSRDSSHRCLALSGFLTVLRHIKLSRIVLSSSESICSDQYSTHSYLTQVAVDMHATQQGTVVKSRVRNEAMCMEVVSILRRCLAQDAQVRELLYTKIYDCAKEKPMLYESLLELFYEHLSKYISEEDTEYPLLVDKCVQHTTTSALLLEPISRLLYAVTQFVQPSEEEDLEDILASDSAETGSTHFKNKLNSILEKLSTDERIGNIDLEDVSLTDLTPESKAKCLQVQQILQCYEVFIAYRITQWTLSSDDVTNSIYKLYKDCEQLMEKTKVPSKNSKKRGKTLNDTRDTVQTQKSLRSQKEKGKKSPNKFTNLAKERAGPFKPLPCLWDLRLCVRVAELLYSEVVPWSSLEQRNQLRSKRDFHDWALRCVLSVLNNDNLDKRAVATYVVKLACIIYTRCICRFQQMWDFDDKTALGCVDVFRACLNLLLSSNYSFKLGFFLPTITGLIESKSSVCIAAMLDHIHSALERVEEETGEGERDAVVKKLVTSLVQTATVLLEVRTSTCVEMSTVIAKFEEYVRTSKRDVLSLLSPVLTAGCREQQEAQLLDDLLLKLISALGRNDEETSTGDDVNMFPAIDSRSGHVVLGLVCGHLNERFRHVEHLLARARDKQTALHTQTVVPAHREKIDREVKDTYKYIVIQLCQLTGWAADAGSLRCCVGGAGSDRVLGSCLRLYTLLAALAKQIDVETALHVRFERLLKVSGRRLSSVTDNLITYLESSQRQRRASTVLRDTKLIPRLVCQAEQYTKNVILLANKAKLNWQHYLSMGTARDFKIKAPVLQEVLNARDKVDESDDDTTVILSMENGVAANDDIDSEEQAGHSDEESPTKRRKL